jgi:hypothetical protein
MRNAQQGLARKLSMYRALDLGVGLEVCVISVKPNTLKLLLTNSGGRFICASAWSTIPGTHQGGLYWTTVISFVSSQPLTSFTRALAKLTSERSPTPIVSI